MFRSSSLKNTSFSPFSTPSSTFLTLFMHSRNTFLTLTKKRVFHRGNWGPNIINIIKLYKLLKHAPSKFSFATNTVAIKEFNIPSHMYLSPFLSFLSFLFFPFFSFLYRVTQASLKRACAWARAYARTCEDMTPERKKEKERKLRK